MKQQYIKVPTSNRTNPISINVTDVAYVAMDTADRVKINAGVKSAGYLPLNVTHGSNVLVDSTTTGSAVNVVTDTAGDFINNGVKPGMHVNKDGEGDWYVIKSVDSPTQLTLEQTHQFVNYDIGSGSNYRVIKDITAPAKYLANAIADAYNNNADSQFVTVAEPTEWTWVSFY